MFCLKCGYELPDDAFFCLKCGFSQKKPVQEQKKRVGIVDVAVRDSYFNVTSTERDIVEWCKQQILAMGYNGECFDHAKKPGFNPITGPLDEIPGRYYFSTKYQQLMNGKNSKIYYSFFRILEDRLLTEGWKKEKDAHRYLKDF